MEKLFACSNPSDIYSPIYIVSRTPMSSMSEMGRLLVMVAFKMRIILSYLRGVRIIRWISENWIRTILVLTIIVVVGQ